ncbi:MAG: molybdopterin adenylyltransferase [Planctomycetota bacterium]|jgi:molybdopterin adenylyltransferase
MNTELRCGILTVSDRASRGEYQDRSGPAIEAVLRDFIGPKETFSCTRVIVPDEVPAIQEAVRGFAEQPRDLILTTGGTGPAPRDITPEAMQGVADKELPGFGEAMRIASLAEGVPTAILSRASAFVVGQSLVINLPGSPKAIRCCLLAVFAAVPDCLALIGARSFNVNPEHVQVYRRQA